MTAEFEEWFKEMYPNGSSYKPLLFNAFRGGFLQGYEKGREL